MSNEKKAVKRTPEFDYKTIKSFEDACKKENIDPEKLPDVSMIPQEFQKAIVNMYKLYIIYKAVNNGWIADYDNGNQLKYYPWYRVGSSGSGFVFSFTFCIFGLSGTAVGSRLCFESSEKCEYVAKQFTSLYEQFLLTK